MLLTALIPWLCTLVVTSEAAPTSTDYDQKPGNASGLSSVIPSGDIYGPSSSLWVNGTTRWSTFSAPTFDLLAIPKDEAEVAETVQYLSTRNIPFLAQGGGHGYSTTLGVIQHGVLINLENFNHIQFNEDQSVTVGGAVVYRDLIHALHNAGRELTVGSCVCVGSTGAMLGGGHGRLQGKHGLGVDNVIKIRIVLWNGSIVEASEQVNSDLFWVVRGAGQNFGVVIESTYKTYPQENDGNHYNADMVFTGDSLEGVTNTINSLIPNQDPALAMDFLVFTDPSTLTPVVYLNLIYAGPQSKGQQYADRFASTPAPPSNNSKHINRLSINATVVSWPDLNDAAAGGAITASCATGSRQNTYSTNLKALDVATVQSLYDSYSAFVKANPLASQSVILFEIFGQKAVEAQPDNYSAVPHRGSSNVLALLQMVYTDDSVAKAVDDWAHKWRDTLASPRISGYPQLYTYQNYAHGDEPLGAVYGYDVWRKQRLTAAKRKYDPKDVFNGYHNIPLNGKW
ncbi:hypothetical protein F5X98DRAFT_371568 [Xylaria grammica]|nr:hypothetical protein F5X98DRAFT_371568 [Xylaria grammica]